MNGQTEEDPKAELGHVQVVQDPSVYPHTQDISPSQQPVPRCPMWHSRVCDQLDNSPQVHPIPRVSQLGPRPRLGTANFIRRPWPAPCQALTCGYVAPAPHCRQHGQERRGNPSIWAVQLRLTGSMLPQNDGGRLSDAGGRGCRQSGLLLSQYTGTRSWPKHDVTSVEPRHFIRHLT